MKQTNGTCQRYSTQIFAALACKLKEIEVIKDNYGMDVIAITETWYSTRIPNGPLTLSRLNIYRRDRQDVRPHIGIASYVRGSIPTELNQPDLETLWITIRPPKMPRDHPQVTIGTIYHPPGSYD